MQGDERPPSRGMAIPGARDESGGNERWRVALQSAGSDGASLSASVQDGFFSNSARRQSTDQGYSHSTFGSLKGHGAWLSSSPHPNVRAFPHRPPLHRTPSLQGTPSGFAGLHAHEEALEAAEVGEAVGSPATAPGSPPVLSPAGTAGTALSRAALARAATAPAEAGVPASPLSPRSNGAQPAGAGSSQRTSFEAQPAQRAQRWYLPTGGTATEASEVAEPLLSGYSQDLPVGTPWSVNPYGAGTPASNKAASAAAAVVAARSGSAAPGELVAIARDVRGQDRGTELSRALVFGGINAVATIPALVAYAAIVFKDPVYAPYIDQLCKFFFLSSAVHQAVFCLLSSLPFAVGQVQDVGLIFLSAMATSIAGICLEAGRDAATALGTSLLTMSVATFFTGACTLLVARYKLAQLVQYLPLPVIGGYLSFVGYFCVASGIGLGVSQDIGSISSWANLFNSDALTKLVPTLLSCFAMIATLEHFSHPLALPTVLAAINVLFHIVRLALGVTLEQAMDANWVIRPAEGEQKFWELWGLFNIADLKLSGIYFPAMAQQVVKTLGLALVVIFGSAMDIAAIQQDTPQKIDFDRELTTVAVSNMATGVAGCGYTGSYIFSQTIFTMRAGVYSRWNGVVVAAAEAVMFALPFSVIQYLPNYFYGALLLWFGVEISRDWLVLSFNKMTRIEYCLLLATFFAILQFGLEGGIAAGIVAATLYFAFAYAQSQVASIGVADSARSSVVRTVEQQAALDMLGGRMTAVSLNGFVFFGSANSIGVRLQQEAERLSPLHQGSSPAAAKSQEEEAEEAIGNSLQTMGERYVGVKHTQAVAAVSVAPAYLVLDFQHVRGLDATGARTMGVVHSDLAQHGVVLVVTGAAPSIRPLLLAHGVPLPPAPLSWPPEMEAPQPADVQPSTRGSLCGSPRGRNPGRSAVGGEPPSPLGAGAASTGSLAAEQPWEERHWPGAADDSLAQPSCLEFATLEQGLRYCEDQLLELAVRYGLCQPPSARMPLEDMLASHLAKVPVSGGMEAGAAANVLRRYVAVVPLAAGQLLWRVGDPANDFFVIEKGVVRVDEFVAADEQQPSSASPPAVAPASSGSGGSLPASASGAPLSDASGRRMVLARSYELGPGCVVGTTDFYLSRPHGTRAVCRSSVARVLRFSRAALERLGVEAPQALNVLQMAVMRANTLDLSQAAQQAPALTS